MNNDGTAAAPGRRGWDIERLAAYAAAGHPPRVLRALVSQYADEDSYRAAWASSADVRTGPDPRCPDVDLAGGWAVAAGDPGFPAHLLDAAAAPFLLFGFGDRSVLESAGVAVVGTRSVTALGEAVAAVTVTTAAEVAAPVISGLARGTDTCAHREAVTVGAPTVAVVATGPDRCLPEQGPMIEHILSAGGVIVSEHPFGTGTEVAPGYRPAPYPARLMARNRIIAALAALTVPCEGTLTSGTMGTVWAALGMGRPVVVALPRPSAAAAPGAQIARAMASPHPLTVARLRAAGASKAVAERVAGTAPLASCTAADRDELALAVRSLWQLSPLVDATTGAAAHRTGGGAPAGPGTAPDRTAAA